jgi:hypothetical protein
VERPAEGGALTKDQEEEAAHRLRLLAGISDNLPEEFDLTPGRRVVSRARFLDHLRSRIRSPWSRYDHEDITELLALLQERSGTPG